VESVTIREQTREDDARVLEIDHAIHPEWPKRSLEQLRHDMEVEPAEAMAQRMVAEVDGEVVGTANWDRALYIADRRTWWGWIAVPPDRRRQGFGSALYERMEKGIREHQGKQLKTEVRSDLPEVLHFVEKRGFRPTGRGDRMSRLNVHTARLDGCRAAASRMAHHGIRIATLAELGPDNEDVLRRLHRLDTETTRDMPLSDEFVEMPYNEWVRRLLESPSLTPDRVWIALDGDRQVGLAFLARRGERAGSNWFTAVDRGYRGKGIARALKLRTVEWAGQNGMDWIYTGNDISNAPMLAINIEMGYEALPASIEMVKELR
jgi:GNAT superfamily N-acetyltransferase